MHIRRASLVLLTRSDLPLPSEQKARNSDVVQYLPHASIQVVLICETLCSRLSNVDIIPSSRRVLFPSLRSFDTRDQYAYALYVCKER